MSVYVQVVSDSDGSAYGNLLAASATALSADTLQSGFSLDSLFADLLAEASQLEPSFTTYDSGSGARQCDWLDVTLAGGPEKSVQLTTGVRNGADYATHVETQLNAHADLSGYSVSYSSLINRYTISNTNPTHSILWNTGTHSTTNIGIPMGYSIAADDVAAGDKISDSDCPINADNSTTAGLGHWVKVDMGSAIQPRWIALLEPRFMIRNVGGATYVDVPSSAPTEIELTLYRNATDLGNLIGTWEDSATEKVMDGVSTYKAVDRTAIGERYGLRLYDLGTSVTATRWWAMRFGDKGNVDGHFPWLRLPMAALGFRVDLHESHNPRPVSRQVFHYPGGVGDADAPALYSSDPPPFRTDEHAHLMDADDKETFDRAMSRIRKKTVIVVPDGSMEKVTTPHFVDHNVCRVGTLVPGGRIPVILEQYTGTRQHNDFQLAVREYGTGI